MTLGRHRTRGWMGFLAASLLIGPAASAISILDPGQGPVVITGIGTPELSGITRQAGNRYLSVADSGAQLHALDIEVDGTSGAITSVSSAGFTTLNAGSDLEGVAWSANRGSVFVSDEVGPAIREYDPVTGNMLGALAVPAVFGNAHLNQSLESLTLAPDESALWTANEVALMTDGPAAQPTAGTWVRLQRFDASFAPDLQLAYRSEPFTGILGITDLVALPDGGLLVLERTLGVLGFSASIFAVDPQSGSDIAGVADLSAGGFVAVDKQLLWTAVTGLENFEGMTLGSALAGGGQSLLLVSDGGGRRPPTLIGLGLFVPEPSIFALLAGGGILATRQRPR